MRLTTANQYRQRIDGLVRKVSVGERVTVLYGWLAALLFVPILVGGIDQATTDALKVQHILKTIEAQQSDNADQKSVITQKELNAYIAYRLAREKDPIIKKLELSLLDNNRVQGNIQFELGGVNLLALFGSDLFFDFDGTLHTRDGGGRLNLASLVLNGQAVPPQTLDAVLVAVARYYGEASGSVNDWYELPKGIQRIEVSQAEAALYY